ncbi:SRPBCC family protein [Actinoalloteichus fjordicus]|uniref:Polyketide cyclase / dehydrase and lipid transport n=1 Tax=Actinoalloteichus fjordicus TaxID=1612552 RepID=A0AAC9LG81_9PSEU|nr:SRPBCC family protein [Actinoalloteichus fjordicus]APU15689.1 Polyketide cyclase / dehydrase and lipid transport [Actinoalloteichus fjordicus]
MADHRDAASAALVLARRRIVIRAPLATIWRLHTDVTGWPRRHPEVREVTGAPVLAEGTSFGLRPAGLDITSTVLDVKPMQQTRWVGRVGGITGTHLWVFRSHDLGVLVDTLVSWDGDPIRADVDGMQELLDTTLLTWLNRLKAAAEDCSLETT